MMTPRQIPLSSVIMIIIIIITITVVIVDADTAANKPSVSVPTVRESQRHVSTSSLQMMSLREN